MFSHVFVGVARRPVFFLAFLPFTERPMKSALRSLVAITSLLACTLGHAEEMRINDLTMDWLDGYRLKSNGSPMSLTGPSGEAMLVTLMGGRPGLSEQERQALRERARAGAENVLIAQAEKAGKVVLPLQRDTLPDGTTLSSVGVETSKFLAKGFFLEYLLVSPTGRMAFITVEGKGDVAEQHARVIPRFQTVSWGDRPAAAPTPSVSPAASPVMP